MGNISNKIKLKQQRILTETNRVLKSEEGQVTHQNEMNYLNKRMFVWSTQESVDEFKDRLEELLVNNDDKFNFMVVFMMETTDLLIEYTHIIRSITGNMLLKYNWGDKEIFSGIDKYAQNYYGLSKGRHSMIILFWRNIMSFTIQREKEK